MAKSPTGGKEESSDLTDIKRKLAWRMGGAGLMIVGLLGGLALFDHYSAPTVTEPSEPQFTEPVPVPKKMVTQPVTPAEPVAEAGKEEAKPAEPESSAAPSDKAAPLVEPPPRPEVAAQPALPKSSQPAARAASAPASAVSPAPAKPAEPKASTAAVAAPRAAAAPESTPAAVAAPAAAPSVPSTPSTMPALSRLFSGFALQAGVFSDPRRAEELHARLMLEGIPSSIESRVEVGPFKTRAEAEAARAKMKALGIDTVLLLPKGGKR